MEVSQGSAGVAEGREMVPDGRERKGGEGKRTRKKRAKMNY